MGNTKVVLITGSTINTCLGKNYNTFATKLIYDGKEYCVSDEEPKDGDLVLTEKYGVWEYSSTSAPIPYWCNKNACKKLILIN